MSDTANSFGPTLRVWRDRLAPVDAGIANGQGRRSPGLRREELAALAGLSVDYLVRLEQGRASNPSAQVVAALARSLQLDDSERAHLYRTAGLLPPSSGRIARHVPPGVQRLISRLGDIPLSVHTVSWDLLSWSPSWALLCGDPGQRSPADRNWVRQMFQDPDLARPLQPWPVHSERGFEAIQAAFVADLRYASGTYPDDPALATLISDLLATSPRFAELWSTGAVGVHASDRKTIDHPVVGPVTVDCDVLTVPGVDVRIVALTAATGTPDAEKIEFLRVAGQHAIA